ncbi:hypothetical protein IMZ48_25210 [Candidatus Bathyarchaeota archaeon]|nr:hypothetical protein [Candidatus Bathyarchaeota archaeon]
MELYHNHPVQLITEIAPELLFARFAWALFTDENMPFFKDAHEYAVLLFDSETG